MCGFINPLLGTPVPQSGVWRTVEKLEQAGAGWSRLERYGASVDSVRCSYESCDANCGEATVSLHAKIARKVCIAL